MIRITQYLQKIYEDLQKYIDNDVCLCKFKKLNFEAGSLPDYEDINIQQLYLLRYAFAYAFEYSRMYRDVLDKMDDVNNISVTSVGCGSMIDYWSLVHALEMKRKIDCSIRYVGIDKIDWNYKIRQRQNDDFACDKGIVTKDNEFKYPPDALEFVKNLNIECSKYKIQKKNCQSDCQNYLRRCPILRVGHIRYQVIMFERVG